MPHHTYHIYVGHRIHLTMVTLNDNCCYPVGCLKGIAASRTMLLPQHHAEDTCSSKKPHAEPSQLVIIPCNTTLPQTLEKKIVILAAGLMVSFGLMVRSYGNKNLVIRFRPNDPVSLKIVLLPLSVQVSIIVCQLQTLCIFKTFHFICIT